MKKITYTAFTLLFLLAFVNQAGALTIADWGPVKPVTDADNAPIISAYRIVADVPVQNLIVPTVLSVKLDNYGSLNPGVAVFNKTTKQFVLNRLVSTWVKSSITKTAKNLDTNGQMPNLVDEIPATTDNFSLSGSVGQSTIELNYSQKIRGTGVSFKFEPNSARPTFITILAVVDGQHIVIRNRYQFLYSDIVFPAVVSDKWIIHLEYSQPLRIGEVYVIDLEHEPKAESSTLFLAQVGSQYSIYLNPEKRPSSYTDFVDTSNLSTATNIKNIPSLVFRDNPNFIAVDSDSDGVVDSKDNCPTYSNVDQADKDSNKKGDACEDYDLDGVIGAIDNCPEVANSDQKDTDGDKIGDRCDPDESRLTEKYPFIIWLGLGFAVLVFLGLLFVVGKKLKQNRGGNFPGSTPPPPPPLSFPPTNPPLN